MGGGVVVVLLNVLSALIRKQHRSTRKSFIPQSFATDSRLYLNHNLCVVAFTEVVSFPAKGRDRIPHRSSVLDRRAESQSFGSISSWLVRERSGYAVPAGELFVYSNVAALVLCSLGLVYSCFVHS